MHKIWIEYFFNPLYASMQLNLEHMLTSATEFC